MKDAELLTEVTLICLTPSRYPRLPLPPTSHFPLPTSHPPTSHLSPLTSHRPVSSPLPASSQLETKGLLHKQLKLSSSLSTSNMTLFDERGRIVKHEAPEAILSSFYTLRLDYYEKRKMHLSEVMTEQVTTKRRRLSNQAQRGSSSPKVPPRACLVLPAL